MALVAHSSEVGRIHERLLAGSPATARFVDIGEGRRAHLIEAGEGTPLLMVHGGGQSALQWLPLLAHLDGVRALAVDRPGFGLSDHIEFPRDGYRESAVAWLDRVLDALELETAALLGNSIGGGWALWYALARPDRVSRLVLAGSPPVLLGTRVPSALRVLAALLAIPGAGRLLPRLMKPSQQSVLQMWSAFGEGETVVRYPEQIEALVAAGGDPVAGAATIAESRAILSPLGVRGAYRVSPEELQRISAPTLLVWGEHDPIGGTSVAHATAEADSGCAPRAAARRPRAVARSPGADRGAHPRLP